MSNYSKYNVIYRLQKWMDSVPGQTFLNYGYSWGASIVILGALFKLTHLPGANFWLFFGMGTEVVVFFLSAFDRPFDKTDDGRELPTRVTFSGEQVFADDEAGDYADESGDYEHSDEADEANVAGGAQPRVVYGRSGTVARRLAQRLLQRVPLFTTTLSRLLLTRPSMQPMLPQAHSLQLLPCPPQSRWLWLCSTISAAMWREHSSRLPRWSRHRRNMSMR